MSANETPKIGGSAFEQQLREMNEQLPVSSVRQHELTEQAQNAEAAAEVVPLVRTGFPL